MNKLAYCLLILLTLIITGHTCHAAKVKAYVNRFTVNTAENRDDLKLSLQTLLMSRLNSNEIQAVEKQSEAELQIEGSYIAFGSIFSLDALLKTSSGLFIERVFVQGDTQNEVIPSVVEIARKLRHSILKWDPALAAPSAGDALQLPVEISPASTAKPADDSLQPIIEYVPVSTVKKVESQEPKPVTVPKLQKLSEKPWASHRLPEPLNGIAIGRTISNKGVEVYITGERYVRYYLKEKNLQFLTAAVFAADEKIIGVDVADLDQNGASEVFVTILKNGVPASQVYIPESNLLIKKVDNLPFMLRSIALEGREKKIFAQKIDADGNFTGDVYELVKKGDNFTTENPLQLPLFGNLNNFNMFSDSKGNQYFIVSHPDGYLLVYSKEKKQLWKSRDKFGGSEAIECHSETKPSPAHLNVACNFSKTQRLLVSKTGDIFVSRNSGSTKSGNTRHYSKNNVIQLSWNGSSLQEKWRTEQSQNYLADFSYDDQLKELLLLEVEPITDTQEERGSRVVAKKIE